MQSSFIIKSEGLWYVIPIEYRAQPSRMTPILDEFWARQDAADVIVNTCGSGVKMAFQNIPKQGGSKFGSISGWYDGDEFDHSPEWSNSPVAPNKSKMVAMNYYNGPKKSECFFDTLDLAIAVVKTIYIYTWDGEKWGYQKTESKFKRTNPWRR